MVTASNSIRAEEKLSFVYSGEHRVAPSDRRAQNQPRRTAAMLPDARDPRPRSIRWQRLGDGKATPKALRGRFDGIEIHPDPT